MTYSAFSRTTAEYQAAAAVTHYKFNYDGTLRRGTSETV